VWPLFSRMNIDEDKVFPLLPLLWIATVVTEALVLKFVNREQPWRRVFVTSAAMNTASFAVLYLILSLL
jgi:energy-converting hydrogenase Eha subunit A